MALDKTGLKTSLKALYTFQYEGTLTEEQDTQLDSLVDDLANAIDVYVKTGTVTVASGITVSTTGTAAAQTGATTSTGTGTIS